MFEVQLEPRRQRRVLSSSAQRGLLLAWLEHQCLLVLQMHGQAHNRVRTTAQQRPTAHSRCGGKRHIHDEVVNASVCPEGGGCFFVDGPGGTEKAFLYKVIVSTLRRMHRTVVSVPWTGMAAMLSPNGATTHSTFKIPLELDATSILHLRGQSYEARALRDASVIIWGEAPMAPANALDAVDRGMRTLTTIVRRWQGHGHGWVNSVKCCRLFRGVTRASRLLQASRAPTCGGSFRSGTSLRTCAWHRTKRSSHNGHFVSETASWHLRQRYPRSA